MAKKRRTRSQKERSATRRKEQVVYSISKSETNDKFVIQNSEPVVKNTTKNTTVTETKITRKWDPLQRRSLRLSLILLTTLLLVQIVLWAVFTYTSIDNRLYDFINL